MVGIRLKRFFKIFFETTGLLLFATAMLILLKFTMTL